MIILSRKDSAKIPIFILVVLSLLLTACGSGDSDNQPDISCGDSLCNGSETCSNCQTDCGTCQQIFVTYKTYGLNFSPYITGQDPNLGSYIGVSQLRNRIGSIAPYAEWIRGFGSTNGLEKTCMVAHQYGLKCAGGAWLDKNTSTNNTETDNLIKAGQAGDLDMAIVGSEVLLRGDLTEAQLITYIQKVKQALPGIPVTYADVYSEILSHPNIISAVDVLFVNYYPYWEGTKIDYAVASIHSLHQQLITAAGGKEVYVSETGWPSCGNTIGEAVPDPVNASYYFKNFVSWARSQNVKYFYFETYDEEWKAQYEGPQGACWGIWDKNGNMKPGMQDIFDGVTIPDNWTCQSPVGGAGTPSISFTYVPPYGSYDNLEGQVLHVIPGDYTVAVYIKVGSGWWTKPYWNNPETNINCDGTWITDITTGGMDQTASQITAYLIANSYNPPLLNGQSVLPPELDQNSAAQVSVIR